MSMSLHKWMTAGRGVVHAEMPVSEEPVQGLQLWVNLRREDKMVEPQYQELKDSQVPKPSREGVTVAVISGQALGVQVRTTILTITLGVQVRSTILTITLGVQVRSTILTITRVVVVGVASCAVLEALFLAAETNCCCFKANFLQFYTFCRGAERTLYCVF
ncbi:pirin-like isoform X31 [Oncorhynchus keta]|uniref:pirin-like isoform X31 n=1 Tax=Oncorhynchus keta TaxID=8018 RepID=UPI00227D1A2F|nr:pirin-like isoform X31 [Oncorhynchus keta]